MKLTLKKPLLVGDAMYLADETVEESDAGRAKFLVEMGHAVAAAPDVKAIIKEPVKTPRNKNADDIGASVGEAIMEALKPSKAKAIN